MNEVKIGVSYAIKELEVETESPPEQIMEKVEAAVGAGGGMLWLEGNEGKRIGVPAEKIAYIQIEGEGSKRPVGFAP